MKLFALLIAISVTVGCSGGPSIVPPVHAQNPTACPPGMAVEYDQHVALMTIACNLVGSIYPGGPTASFPGGMEIAPKEVVGESKAQIVLTKPLHLQAISMWQGTAGGPITTDSNAFGAAQYMEAGMSLEIKTPDGHYMAIFRELDKHQDVIGNYDDWRQLHLELPVGTVLTLRRQSYVCISAPRCATQEMIRLFGTF